MSKIITVADHINMSLSEIKTPRKSTVPLILTDIRQRPTCFASGILYKHSGIKFLITAAHAFRDSLNSDSNLYAGAEGKFHDLAGARATYTNLCKDGEDNIDLCAFDLRDSEANQIADDLFLEQSALVTGDNLSHCPTLALLGFPASKNKTDKFFDRNSGNLKVNDYIIGVKRIEVPDGFKKDFNHLAFSYGEKLITGYNNNPQNPFSLKGMSGCGTWIIPDINKPEQVFLGGIFIEHYSKKDIGFSIKADRLIEIIEKYLSETSEG